MNSLEMKVECIKTLTNCAAVLGGVAEFLDNKNIETPGWLDESVRGSVDQMTTLINRLSAFDTRDEVNKS